jgi:salicylate hydroxylase
VRVYEQAAELGEVGAGVGLYPNSMRLLQRLGVADSVTRHRNP